MRVIDSNCIKQPRIAKLESMEESCYSKCRLSSTEKKKLFRYFKCWQVVVCLGFLITRITWSIQALFKFT